MALIPLDDITGLVLAGGRGQRMGGVDKGLQLFHGKALAWHALQRIAPQVGSRMVCANRHLDLYQALGAPVVTDTLPDHPGPLAGFLAGLQRCRTPWMLTVPCDAPALPFDLAARLGEALLAADADIALAATRENGQLQRQPVFSLLTPKLAASLARFVAEGGRSIARWAAGERSVEVPFDDTAAFANANTLDDLEQLQRLP